MNIHLEKGHGQIQVEIPDHQIIAVLQGKQLPPMDLEDLRKIIADALKAELPADITKKKIGLLIPDDTRLWARGDLFVPVIAKTLLDLGVQREKICVIIALGTHADMPEEKFPLLAGDYTAASIRIVNSANKDEHRLVSLGITSRSTELSFTKEAVEAEHIIVFGGVLHHMLAGYGGGRKYIFPGVAGYDSIQQNHSLALSIQGTPHPQVCQTQLAGNPVHEDIQEATQSFLEHKSCTYVAVTANGQGEIYDAAVGPLDETFTRSCQKLDEACCLDITEKADFALISAGGHRTDRQLYQATKALFNSVNAVKEGGNILFVAGCQDGAGNALFEAALKKYHQDSQGLGKKLTESFDMASYVAYRVIDLLDRFTIILVSDLSKEQTRNLGFNYSDNLEIYVKNLRGRGYIIPFAENILPLVRKTEE